MLIFLDLFGCIKPFLYINAIFLWINLFNPFWKVRIVHNCIWMHVSNPFLDIYGYV